VTGLLALFAFVIGAVIGSFLNVVIYRLPAGLSVVWPRSRCPHCGHTLTPLELVPILSWVAQRGRCRNCQAPIAIRYPLVEALTGVLFAAAALLRPEFPGLLLIWGFIALLIALAFIDLDTYELPWGLNYGGLALGLLGARLLGYPQPFSQALDGALIGAGFLAMINAFGVLLMLRGRNNAWTPPWGYPQINLAAAVGSWLGPAAGLVAGFLNVAFNLRSPKPFRIPDALALGLAVLGPLVALLIPGWGLTPLSSLRAWLLSAGGLALAGGIYWWIQEWRHPSAQTDDGDEVVAMGFGDVILMGFLGAWLGVANLGVALLLAVVAGAVIGLVVRRMTGENKIPFGPYLALGGLVAFFFGQDLIAWYLGYIGAR